MNLKIKIYKQYKGIEMVMMAYYNMKKEEYYSI